MKTNPPMMKHSVLVALLLMIVVPLHAQQNYKLSDYVNPNYRYQSLDFNMNLNASGNSRYNDLSSSTWRKDHNSSLGGTFNIGFYQSKNNLRYQGTQRMSLSSDGGWGKSDTQNSGTNYSATNKRNSLGAGFDYYSTNLFYHSRKRFLEIDPDVALRLDRYNETDRASSMVYPYNSRSLSNSHSTSFGLSVMAGSGRIENVENARLALYILNDLQKSGDIKENLSNEQVDQLARFITKLRSKRFFDSRIRNIANITSVDSLLTAMGIREHSGASYFMILNDDWNYANGPGRQSGHRFAFGVTPGYSGNFSKSTDDTVLSSDATGVSRTISTNKIRSQSIDFRAYYYLEKPVSLTWQHSTRASLGYELGKRVDSHSTDPAEASDDKMTLNRPNWHASFEKIYGYYPNSRTNLALDFRVSGRYLMQDQENSDALDNNQLSLYTSLSLKGNYYFSPQLRLNLNAGIHDDYVHFDNNTGGTSSAFSGHFNNLHPSLTLSLRYSIF